MLSIARNSTKIYKKILEYLQREKSAEKYFHEIYYCIVTPAQRLVASNPKSIKTMNV